MLKFTGHPLVDVGAATIAAFGSKPTPEDVEETDLQVIADYMTDTYTKQPMQSFLTVVFMNSGFVQGSYTLEKRLEYAKEVLQAYKNSATEENGRCVFFPDQISHFRAERKHLPLITGATPINFHPGGEPGLPVSGLAMLCIHALPLGCAKVAGRLLAVWSDNNDILMHFAREFLKENRTNIQLAQQTESTKMPESLRTVRTRLIETLLSANRMRHASRQDEQPFSVTAYHLSNSGQDPSLDIYHLPLQIIGFLQDVNSAMHRAQWERIVHSSWEKAPAKKGKKGESADNTAFVPKRNYVYEDLLDLPHNALRFLQKYFIHLTIQNIKATMNATNSSNFADKAQGLAIWEITASFIHRILNMEKEKIEQIRNMGDALAKYVASENDRRFFTAFFKESRYEYLRNALIKANLAYVKQGNPPFLELIPYIAVFEDGEEMASREWKLARDLVLIRMIEQLHLLGWLSRNQDAIPTENLQEDKSE